MSLTVSLIAFSGATPCKGAIQVKENAERGDTYDELRSQSAIESHEALIPKDFPCTVYAVLIQKLANNRTSLILHPEPILSQAQVELNPPT